MKTKLVIILGALLIPLFSLAQSEISKTQVFYIIKSPGSSKEILSINLLVDGSGIAKLDIVPASEGIKRFGKIPKDAVIAVVTLKTGIKLLTLSQLYAIHGVNGDRRKLPVAINGSNWTDTTNLLIAGNSLKVIKIRTDSIELMTVGHVKELERRKLERSGTKINR